MYYRNVKNYFRYKGMQYLHNEDSKNDVVKDIFAIRYINRSLNLNFKQTSIKPLDLPETMSIQINSDGVNFYEIL